MRLRRAVKPATLPASGSGSVPLRCCVCARFTKTTVAGGRCEPCAGVLPLDFTPTVGEDREGLARLCAELGEHEWDGAGTAPCPCGQPHPFRICARCLTPEVADCEVAQ